MNLLTNREEYTVYFSAGLKTYRVSRINKPDEYNQLISLPKFYPVLLDTKPRTDLGSGIVNLGYKHTYVPPRQAVEVRTLGSLLLPTTSPPPDILDHSLYNPRPSCSGAGIGKLMGKVFMSYPEGQSIQVYQLSAPPANCLIKEEKWTPLGATLDGLGSARGRLPRIR
jgi:hypothetical protein